MNRDTFLKELDGLLSSVAKEEREEVLQYYREYFDDAGSEKEADVIKELGTPAQIANQVKATLQGESIGYEYGEGNSLQVVKEQWKEEKKESKKLSTGVLVLLIVLGILASPFIFALLVSVLGILFGALVTIGALLFAAVATLLSLLLAAAAIVATGIMLVVAGFMAIGVSPIAAMMMIGIGLLITGISLFVVIGLIWVIGYLVPAIWKGICWLCKQPVKWMKGWKK